MSDLTRVVKNEDTTYVRWSLNERVQHWVLAVSFILLVLTGFGLRYPQAWWVRPLAGIPWLFDLRGLLHRVAGAVFLALGIYHVYYMLATKRGRMITNAFRPRMLDLRDLVHNIAYNFGLRQHPPNFRHFSYMEKAEYFALIWGAVIMGITGLMLWFETTTLTFFPRWVIDLVTVIHLYEAWLATLAIVVWHFYYVIFNPDVYPVNTSMVDGKITEKEMRHEYYLEWQQLQEDQNQEAPDREREKALQRQHSK
ncbi:cytochrome b/b6 domain-containing protein [candidate division KSB1 bacterium]|nr:cytochrome b/b6 domain-containing protein [candidate division KSB1 bacterium]NIR70613.1 cytochrome b/b6 domain-containing protein [candidate division KSB1 bacterium]NIS24558.1 cytochrome b/b6 domain-containing protein [candidate division KSB1 bacterium]NIT71476.1 cytochrome b/b6 domain-containing protein [candidate division KSB1 bacterium]NIU25167.1 cytochrome b/b6 domain-containing protein [candidate division KSB1 bacterium]